MASQTITKKELEKVYAKQFTWIWDAVEDETRGMLYVANSRAKYKKLSSCAGKKLANMTYKTQMIYPHDIRDSISICCEIHIRATEEDCIAVGEATGNLLFNFKR